MTSVVVGFLVLFGGQASADVVQPTSCTVSVEPGNTGNFLIDWDGDPGQWYEINVDGSGATFALGTGTESPISPARRVWASTRPADESSWVDNDGELLVPGVECTYSISTVDADDNVSVATPCGTARVGAFEPLPPVSCSVVQTFHFSVSTSRNGVDSATRTYCGSLILTDEGPGLPVSPAWCGVALQPDGTVLVDWQPNGDDRAEQYVVRRSRNGGQYWWAGLVDASTLEFNQGNLGPASTYSYSYTCRPSISTDANSSPPHVAK